MSKVKHSNLKIVDQKREEAMCHEEAEISDLTPAEIRARVREIRRYLEKVRDGLEGVPFDAVAHAPGSSIRDIGDRSISDLVEHLNPFIKGWCEHCKENLSPELRDEFGFLEAGLADTGFAIGVLFGTMTHGASEQEIDRLERGFIHANALRWWYKEGRDSD